MSAPAGWYPDPAGTPQRRWWNGAQWTDAVEAEPELRPAPAAPIALPQPPRAPEGTNPYTAWIWLTVFAPLLGLASLIPFANLDWAYIFGDVPLTEDASAQYQLDMTARMYEALGPAYLLTVVGGWVLTVLVIVFALLDWRALKARQVPQPFHWAWALLSIAGASSLVYVIGRIVVVRRRTGGGLGVLWALIATAAVGLIAGVVLVVLMVNGVLGAVMTSLPGS